MNYKIIPLLFLSFFLNSRADEQEEPSIVDDQANSSVNLPVEEAISSAPKSELVKDFCDYVEKLNMSQAEALGILIALEEEELLMKKASSFSELFKKVDFFTNIELRHSLFGHKLRKVLKQENAIKQECIQCFFEKFEQR